MAKVSAVISAYNEDGNIERCLKSLEFADEIIVINNSSTDKTQEIAKKYTDKVFVQKNNPLEIDIQKNFGFEKATSDWILSIDADEEVTPELAKEIKSTTNNQNTAISGYWIPRKNIIFGKFIENTGWYPDPQLRLFKKGKGFFVKAHVHEPVKLNGEAGFLKEHLIHHHYNSILEFLNKTILIYAPNEAKEYLEKGYKFSYFDAVRFPLNEFLSRFFARKGYKDGFHGLMLSILMSIYHFLIFAYIWEENKFPQYNSDNFEKDFHKEFITSGKQISFWLMKLNLESIKNPVKKTFKKISNKIHNL